MLLMKQLVDGKYAFPGLKSYQDGSKDWFEALEANLPLIPTMSIVSQLSVPEKDSSLWTADRRKWDRNIP